MKNLTELSKEIHAMILSKGFDKKTLPEALLLIHSEVSEATEEYRNGRAPNETYYNPEKPTKPEGIPSELADIIIRVLDMCGEYEIDIDSMINEKLGFNKTREQNHGGKII